MQLPPTSMVLEALREIVGPPFAVGVGVLLFSRIALGKSTFPFAAVLAFIAALATGNHLAKINPDWWPTDKRLTWLPWLAAAGCVAGLVARKWPRAGVSLWAMIAAVAVVRVLVDKYFKTPWWGLPAFVLLPSAIGFGLMRLDEKRPGFAAPFVLGCALMAAGTVIIHAHSKSLLDVATLGGMCLLGIAAVVAFAPGETGPAMPGAALLLVGISFAGYHETSSDVPDASFALPALAPLLSLVGLIPAVNRLNRNRRSLLVILPALIAMGIGVGLAMRAETIRFDDAF
jgi:hypothetical protein